MKIYFIHILKFPVAGKAYFLGKPGQGGFRDMQLPA